jgi:hypothetical protein
MLFFARIRRRRVLLLTCLVLSIAGRASCVFAAVPTPADTLLIEPETFVALGPWQRTGIQIQSSNMAATAFAGFRIQEPGTYHVWTRTQDFPASQPGSRRLLLKIDETPVARESGTHGREGWYWEQVGEAKLDEGLHLLEIVDTARFYARLDAIIVTRSDFDPNTRSRAALDVFTTAVVQPERVKTGSGDIRTTAGIAPLAELANADVTIRFRAARTPDGKERVVREVVFADTSTLTGASLADAGAEELLVIRRTDPGVSFDAYFPSWQTDAQTEWLLAGRRLRRPADARDPFVAGSVGRLHPVAARPLGKDAAELVYRGDDGLEARAIWRLPARGFSARMEVSMKTPEAGCYSFAFGTGRPVARGQVTAVQLPPLYQFQRLPDSPQMITSSETPHPFALVETGGGLTAGVFADPAGLTQEWATRSNATYGFSLVDPSGEARPFIFTPILGGAGSRLARGEKLSASWWVGIAPLPWDRVMRAADRELYGLRDYREPVTASLTEQALNIIDLMRDDAASGWNARLKGPANIESPSTVTHAAPLMYLSAARLTRDEAFFRQRAEPAMEYLLSRPGAHFALSAEKNLYVTEATAKIAFDNVFYGSAIWQGFDDLTGGLNPWLREKASRKGTPLKPRNNSAEPDWSGMLALYRLQPDAALLAKICFEANGWLERVGTLNQTTTRGIQPFYNVAFYPYWWDLLDLYELTSDARYLDAAKGFANQTVAGQWVTPPVAPGDTTLYPGGRSEGSYLVWWKDQDRFRLGWQDFSGLAHGESLVHGEFKIPEKKVPAWQVSVVGLGVEQPISYISAASRMSNIQLTVWAANLLRLAGATGDDYWRTFARNAVIGRGASYPGYYLSDYLDLALDRDYPGKGPDLTYLYWHHVPVHLAMLVDYLFTDAEMRTKGAVRFPYSKQQGYVWFSSRIYGGKPGRVFDDAECWPWLDRTKFRVATPKVDYLAARSREQFHLVLMNQAQGATVAPVELDYAALGISPDATPRLRTATGDRVLPVSPDGTFSLPLEKGAFAVLSFATKPEDVWPRQTPVTAKPVSASLDDGWGELRGYRVRSPFGRDTVYVALSARPDSGTAALEVEGDAKAGLSLDAYPYEFSLPGLALERTVRFRVQLTGKEGKRTLTPWFELTGTPRT